MYIYIYIYIYILQSTPRSPILGGSTIRLQGTWCIHVVEVAKLQQNWFQMGSKHLFEHAKWFWITSGKTRF